MAASVNTLPVHEVHQSRYNFSPWPIKVRSW